MNPQQPPLTDSGIATPPEQSGNDAEPALVNPVVSATPTEQPVQVSSGQPVSSPILPVAVESSAAPTVTPEPPTQPYVAPAPTVVAAATPNPAGPGTGSTGVPLVTPATSMEPSSPGTPTVQPPVVPSSQQTTPNTPMSFNQSTLDPGTNKKKMLVKFGVIGAAVLVILGAVIFGFLAWQNSQLTLETYEGDGYSILVPSDYIETEEDDGMRFVEDTDDKTSQSFVYTSVDSLDTELTQEEIDDGKTFFTKELLEESLQSDTFKGDADVTEDTDVANFALETKDSESGRVISGTADIEKDGKKVADLRIQLEVSKKGASIVYVVAHVSDPALSKQSQAIIDSFEVE